MSLKSLGWEENQLNGVEANSPWHSHKFLEVHTHRTEAQTEAEVLDTQTQDSCQYLPLPSCDFWAARPSGKTTFTHWINPYPTRYIRKTVISAQPKVPNIYATNNHQWEVGRSFHYIWVLNKDTLEVLFPWKIPSLIWVTKNVDSNPQRMCCPHTHDHSCL